MEINLPNLNTPTLKDQVYSLLLNLIIDGKYSTDDLLPPERVLCEELGVSRTVVREAVKALEAQGILKTIHGKGIKVNPASSTDIANAFMIYLRRQKRKVSMKDLLEARYAFETEIAYLAALNIDKDDLKKVEDIIKRMKKAKEDVEKFIKVDVEYHLQLAYATKNIIFVTIMEALIVPLRKSREETVSVEDNEQSFKEHLEIYYSIKLKKPEKAKKAMEKHLKHVRDVLEKHGKL